MKSILYLLSICPALHLSKAASSKCSLAWMDQPLTPNKLQYHHSVSLLEHMLKTQSSARSKVTSLLLKPGKDTESILSRRPSKAEPQSSVDAGLVTCLQGLLAINQTKSTPYQQKIQLQARAETTWPTQLTARLPRVKTHASSACSVSPIYIRLWSTSLGLEDRSPKK